MRSLLCLVGGEVNVTNYERGRRKEYKIKKELESKGWIVLRSAGSHGFADLVAIKEKEILFIQAKPDNFSKLYENRLIEKHKDINGFKECKFEVR